MRQTVISRCIEELQEGSINEEEQKNLLAFLHHNIPHRAYRELLAGLPDNILRLRTGTTDSGGKRELHDGHGNKNGHDHSFWEPDLVAVQISNPQKNLLKVWLIQHHSTPADIVTRETRIYTGNESEISQTFRLSPLIKGATEDISVKILDHKNEIIFEKTK